MDVARGWRMGFEYPVPEHQRKDHRCNEGEEQAFEAPVINLFFTQLDDLFHDHSLLVNACFYLATVSLSSL